MMERDAKYFTIGAFVSLTLLALVGFSIWLAGVHDFARHTRYTIYFTDPVSGGAACGSGLWSASFRTGAWLAGGTAPGRRPAFRRNGCCQVMREGGLHDVAGFDHEVAARENANGARLIGR